MGVYLPNIEMPKNCGECFVKSCKGRAKNKRLMVQRGEDCPLVPVPPHGRLIDADELYERAKLRSERFNGYFNDLDNVINALYIETFPTIIPAEEGE